MPFTVSAVPLATLASSSAQVAALRLAMLPWWCMTDPLRAQREAVRMVSEKQQALFETHRVMAGLPLALTRRLLTQPSSCGLQNARHMTELAVTGLLQPSQLRVDGNRRRLSGAMHQDH